MYGEILEKHSLFCPCRMQRITFGGVSLIMLEEEKKLVNLKRRTDMKTAVYFMRCLTDLTMGDETLGINSVMGEGEENIPDELLGEFDIPPLIMMREIRRTLDEKAFPYMDYVFGGGHFAFHKGRLVASPGSPEDEGDEWMILNEDGWEEEFETMMNDLWSSQVQPDISPNGVYNKIRTELEALPIVRKRKRKRRREVLNAANQPAIPADSCFIFFINYDDQEKFEALDRMLRQETFEIGTDLGNDRGTCKIINIS